MMPLYKIGGPDSEDTDFSRMMHENSLEHLAEALSQFE